MHYAELFCRTNYSFLQGASHPSELVARAAELGLSALAVTDRNGVYGMPRAYAASKEFPRLKLIVGSELVFEDGQLLTLLARDRAAYGLMCRLITAAHADKPKGTAFLRWTEFYGLMDAYSGKNGLIAMSSTPDGRMKDHFKDRLYIPLSRHLDGLDQRRTQKALELSRKLDLRIVATNDTHYHVPERRKLQDSLSAIREGKTLAQAGRRLFSNSERHLKSPQEMSRLFRDMPDAIAATLDIAESCVFSPKELRYRYPSEWIPADETAQSYLEKLVVQGSAKRYPDGVPSDVRKQLNHELKLIGELGFADYFLTIWEIVEFSRQKDILCQGRGSAANSAVCYCLGITAVDPVRMNLLFERFISAERGEPPDIDVDFENARREEVIQHIYEKYGRHRAAMVAAVTTYQRRMANREMTKIFEAEPPQELVEDLISFPRHLSIHSGGFTLSADPLIETVPVELARMEGRTIVQWDKNDLESIGLLKVDILSLGMLTAIKKTFDLVPHLSLATVPAEDPATYEMIQRGDTIGVFQIESRAQMNMLGRLKPKNFYDLVIEVAIVRPGPIVGKMVHPYLRRRDGLEPADIPDPRLEPILRKTLGVPLFQEQVMKIAMALGGFTPGEADELRRAIAGWRVKGPAHERMDRMGKKLYDGLTASGLTSEYAKRILDQIRGFAEYGFPESHAASFALLAYASSYLKCHHPAEFTCALINAQPMGFYSNHTLVDDVKRHGVQVFPVDPNRSEWDCVMENRGIRLGLRVVKGLARAEADAWIAERSREPFTGLGNFLDRVRLKPTVLSRLAMGDAFVGFGLDQRHALWEILGHDLKGKKAQQPQQGLFETLDFYEAIRQDYSAYHLSARGHPMAALREQFQGKVLTTAQARALPHGSVARVAGLGIVLQRPPTAKGTAFATVEDETGILDMVLFKDVFEKYREVILEHSLLVATGVVQKDRDSVGMLLKKVEPYWGEDLDSKKAMISHGWWSPH